MIEINFSSKLSFMISVRYQERKILKGEILVSGRIKLGEFILKEETLVTKIKKGY